MASSGDMVTSEIKLGLVLADSTPGWAMAHTYPAPPLRATNIAPPPHYSIVFVYFSSSVCNARPACKQYWCSSTSFSTHCILLYFCVFVSVYLCIFVSLYFCIFVFFVFLYLQFYFWQIIAKPSWFAMECNLQSDPPAPGAAYEFKLPLRMGA